MKRIYTTLLVCIFLSGGCLCKAWEMPDFSLPDVDFDSIKEKVTTPFKDDAVEQQIKYLNKLEKEEAKKQYEKKVLNRTPSGFMTVEEYELLSAPKDKTIQEIEIPKIEKPSDMKYVPQPTYKIVRYNDPPGSPELNLKKRLYQTRQMNAQGITSPDFSILVYPSVYYYPSSASVACDLFVIPLEQNDTNLNKIMKANVAHRIQEPILSTDKSINEAYTFRTLTPIDFSVDGTKLLVKEKVGYSKDGIWQTNAIVYDFSTKTSYDLKELRAAIVYYWKQYKYLNLDDKRWDIYPLGFDVNEPDRVVAYAYAYTGKEPVFLGAWSVDSKGEQTRLISFHNKDVNVSINGFKIVQDGVVPADLVKKDEKYTKKYEKSEAKRKKAEDEAELKRMEDEYKARVKEIDKELKNELKEYKHQNKIQGATSFNDAAEKYETQRAVREQKRAERIEKKRLREEAREQRRLQKEQEKNEKESINSNDTEW